MQPGAIFGDKSSLKDALNEWCTNPTDAHATYGYVSSWDVSAITDMSWLLPDLAMCHDNFDQDIDGWDVGQVTNMQVGCAHVAGKGPSCSQHR
jgi:hypothetical protein